MEGWIGKANRESEATPVLHFRQVLQSLALLRKYKGALRLTRAGAAAQQAPEELWNRLADKLVPAESDFNADATLLLLAYAATSADAELPLDEVAAAVTAAGWQTGDGGPIERRDLYWIPRARGPAQRDERTDRLAGPLADQPGGSEAGARGSAAEMMDSGLPDDCEVRL